ncbi:MAG: hypothetical protein ACPLTQ_11430, partial [Anaerolineae bacterium]
MHKCDCSTKRSANLLYDEMVHLKACFQTQATTKDVFLLPRAPDPPEEALLVEMPEDSRRRLPVVSRRNATPAFSPPCWIASRNPVMI